MLCMRKNICLTLILTLFLMCSFKTHDKNIIQISNINTTKERPKKNFNTLTATQMSYEISGVGKTKSAIILAERQNNGMFTSPEDFEKRMQGKLSNKMIYKIISQYSFEEGCDGARNVQSSN